MAGLVKKINIAKRSEFTSNGYVPSSIHPKLVKCDTDDVCASLTNSISDIKMAYIDIFCC